MFLLLFWWFAPESVWKNSLVVRSAVFSGFVLSSFRFFVDVVFFKRHSSGSHRTPPHTHLFCLFLFSFCVPPLVSVSPVLAVRPASRLFFSGCHSGPRGFGILLELMGLELRSPLPRPLSLDARRQGFFVFLVLFFFFPFLFCGHTLSRKARPVISRRPAAGDRARPLARVRARGSASSAEGWSPPFVGF